MAHSTPKLIFGTAGIARFSDESAKKVYQLLDQYNVKHLDTAFIYVDSEKTLEAAGAPSKYIIDTKAPGFQPKCLAKQSVLDGNAESLKRLGVSQVDTYYLHAPDPETPLSETLSAITLLYNEGKFKRFGLSNFSAADVQEIYDHQKRANGVLPTVFQGNYSAVSRHIESDLFPLLRKLNIAFNAYSPIGGGFLVKSPAALRAGEDTGRFSQETPIGKLYSKLYAKESLLAALEEWAHIAEDEGVSKAALAYRWVAFHGKLDAGAGDGIILGASKPEQLDESLAAIKDGPLSAKSAERIDAIWKSIEKDAPLNNYTHSA